MSLVDLTPTCSLCGEIVDPKSYYAQHILGKECKGRKDMINHKMLVETLVKDGNLLLEEATPEKMHLNHMMLGITGECGELVDAIKKFSIYNKELDIENVIEELGDLEFYMEGIRATLGISRQTTLDHNIQKLSKRYEGLQYADHKAINRADKT